MRQGEVPLYIIGGVKAAPELRFTQSGKAVASFDVVSTRKRKNDTTGEWEDGEKTWVPITMWGRKAEAVANELKAGSLVIVVGRWKQNTWEDREGNKRSRMEGEATDVGHLIIPRRDGDGGSSFGSTSRQQGPSNTSGFGGGNSNPWGGAPTEGSFPTNGDNEPPF